MLKSNFLNYILFFLRSIFLLALALLIIFYFISNAVLAANNQATTTVTVSICGNSMVEGSEQCDVPGQTGEYSTTKDGRQCSVSCFWGPYCGDGIMQTIYGEECDDGNNESGDFCSATCRIEPAGHSGGGGSGGSGRSGGGSVNLGDSSISVSGSAYPGRTINILLDSEPVGSVRVATNGRFEFATKASPGTASLSFWSTDESNTRSITFNTTFDVTQGAITNISGVTLPPTLRVSKQNVNPGDKITVSGQAVPNATIELHIDKSSPILTTTSDAKGLWSLELDTGTLSIAEHILKARSITGTSPLLTQSSFSTALQLFVGVDGKVTSPSDLNRDGKVNLIDFSILIFWWDTNGGNSNPPADISGNGKVGLEDFSILLFNWTG